MNNFCHFVQCKARSPWSQHFSNFVDISYRFWDIKDFFFFFNSAPHGVLKIWSPKKGPTGVNGLIKVFKEIFTKSAWQETALFLANYFTRPLKVNILCETFLYFSLWILQLVALYSSDIYTAIRSIKCTRVGLELGLIYFRKIFLHIRPSTKAYFRSHFLGKQNFCGNLK